MPFPDPSSLLQGCGFRKETEGGYQLQVSRNGNCVFIYGWNIESVRLWYSVFLVECTDITLFYMCVCKAKAFYAGHTAGANGQPAEEGASHAKGSGSSAAGTDDEWIVTYTNKVTETSCTFGSGKDTTHTELDNLFNTKMGLHLPDPPKNP